MIYISLNREESVSLNRQIYTAIREAILKGILKENEKLPSTRELAGNLRVARNVVIESYDQLLAEGYIYTKNGSGTYVSDGICFEVPFENTLVTEHKIDSVQAEANVNSFRTGIPDLASVPVQKWGRFYREIAASIEPKFMDYQTPYGAYELRYQLAVYLRRVRGVKAKPDNILITNGAAQAFSLLCQLVSDSEYALVENPLSRGILHTLEAKKVKMKAIPVDELGMVTSRLPKLSPKLIFTTPSHQFPTGVILPVKRRVEMIQYARNCNAYIVEDDYDSEFRFDGSPVQSMQMLDPASVIYVGTFSKTFMPSLRMGYVVLPDSLYPFMKSAKYIADIHSPVLEQLTMAKFIQEGFLDLHIKKMRSIYLKRRNYFINCLKKYFGESVSISGAEAGMHFVASFRGILFDCQLMEKIRSNQLQITSLMEHFICEGEQTNRTDFYESSLIFGYGNTDEADIEEGVMKLHTILLPQIDKK